MADDIRENSTWPRRAVDTEWRPLREVLLYLPGPEIATLADPVAALHLTRIDHRDLRRQHDALVRCYEDCGIRVHHVNPEGVEDLRHPNLVFQRDTFWQTPMGAVISRMASEIRAGEEEHTARTLADLGVSTALTIGGRGTLEGADCLWIDPRTVLCGVGGRTNRNGCRQLSRFLALNGVECLAVPGPQRLQHLLGCVQIVSSRRALVRTDHAAPELVRALATRRLEIVEIADTEEITRALAFNFLVIDRDRVIAPTGTPAFHRLLGDLGIEIAAKVEISEYVHAAGGIACATGILSRETRPSRPPRSAEDDDQVGAP
jgi:N-dimethylarginine dimethylaminohydrolase